MVKYKDGKSQSETIAGVISDIDTSQLNGASNTINVRQIAEESQYKSTKAINEDKNVDAKTAYSASTFSEPDIEHFSETKRFSKKLEIPEGAKVQGTNSGRKNDASSGGGTN